jgi:hypothetical protein
MQPYPIRPGTPGPFSGEALTLWRLRRDSAWIRCFVAEWPGAFWLAVECAGGELLTSETLPAIDVVLARSADVRAMLLREGWLEE